MTAGADALVVGGGVIGRSIAFELAEAGAAVTLIDAGPSRPRASEAAAGILGAQLESHADGPLARLCIAGRDRFAAFAARVEGASGVALEHRTCGALLPAFDEAHAAALVADAAWQTAAGFKVEALDGDQARAIEPALSREVVSAVRYPEDARVEPRALTDALGRACAARGVVQREGAVRALTFESRSGARVTGAELEDGALSAKLVVLAAGSWSSLVDRGGLDRERVTPARGQMVELRTTPGLVRGVVVGKDAYLSPRDDGRLLVGSTVEFVGYDVTVTARALSDLFAGALRLVPALADARFSRAWAGLRPHARGALPLIGKGAASGLIVATGHFRNGVLLSAITAEIVAALARGEPAPFDITPFDPQLDA